MLRRWRIEIVSAKSGNSWNIIMEDAGKWQDLNENPKVQSLYDRHVWGNELFFREFAMALPCALGQGAYIVRHGREISKNDDYRRIYEIRKTFDYNSWC